MSLETIIKEIKALKPFAEEDVESGPIETLNGRRGRKNQAIGRLQVLRREYRSDLLRSALFIIVTGNKRNDFETLATSEKFGLFASDPETFYKDLANRVHPSLYQQGNASTTNLFDVLGRHLEDKMSELDVSEYNQIIFKEKYIDKITSPEQFATVVKTAINEQMGSEIVGVQAAQSILDQAIELGHSAKLTPIVLNTGDDKLAVQLSEDLARITSRVFLVTTSKATKVLKTVEGSIAVKEVTEDSVKDTLDKIKNSIKK